jgi:beta-N-acetylhexosaminidase
MFVKSIFLKFTALSCFLNPIQEVINGDGRAPVDDKQTVWVNEQYNGMSLDEKIGQLFMVDAYTVQEKANKADILNLIKNYKIGGVIFFKGNAPLQAAWTNEFQANSKIPLLIGIDAEWGLAMRLENTIQFPHQLTLGAIRDNNLIYEMGREIGLECKRIGVHVNFAPVVDVNNNPKNPVINDRSFGEDKWNVAIKGLSYMQGMQDVGIMACAKHFPGHGNVSEDSHFTLPTVSQPLDEMKNLELFPFQTLINNQLQSIMAAHLFVPCLENSPGVACSLSPKVCKDLLRDQMGFTGLVFSDALNMKGVASYFEPGEIEVKAFNAGNDVLLFSQNVPLAIAKIKEAYTTGVISERDLEISTKRILTAKYQAGLNHYAPVSLTNIDADLNNVNGLLIKQKLFENAMTIAANKSNELPFLNYKNAKFAILDYGENKYTDFEDMLNNYAKFNVFNLPKEASADAKTKMINDLSTYDYVVIGVHEMSRKLESNYGLSQARIDFINNLSSKTKVVLVLFGSPYSLQYFDYLNTTVVAYEDNEYAQRAAAQVLFGGIPALGKLPVSASPYYSAGKGFLSDTVLRLKYTIPEEVGLHAADFSSIDNTVLRAMNAGAMPGAQVLIAKGGKVIYNKAFGYADYNKTQTVSINNLYDIASCTKICAPTIEAMDLVDEGKLDLNKTVQDYLSLTADATINNIKVKDLLLHEAGLTPFIPFYKKTIESDIEKALAYRNTPTTGYTLPVANNLYIRNNYPEQIWNIIQSTPLSTGRKFVYSDLSMYIMRRIEDQLTGTSIDQYMKTNFYWPMGLQRLTYNPLQNGFDAIDCMPTENDMLFRKQTIRGYVHDPGAAMMGGVSGHAGIFANASDLASLMQMLLNGGTFAGKRFLEPSTIDLFTHKESAISRRGYGFDKPEPDPNKTNPCSDETPLSTFGHTGFTGTCIWVDPENQLIYVFLSNRVNPNAENWKLVSMGVRTEIQSTIYKAIKNAKSTIYIPSN